MRLTLAATSGVLLVAAVVVPGTAPAPPSRYDELRAVIDRNTGFAHLTRGMNIYTLIALRECVTAGDIPVLVRMLADPDHVSQLAAANVLADLGDEGRRGLRQGWAAARDVRTRVLIEEALREADSPTRRAILDYPPSARERAGIRGCRR